jgi:HPt (histidine-containing phosphotransfer) domain-containing protein
MGRDRNGQPLFKRLYSIFQDETPILIQNLDVRMMLMDVDSVYDAIHQMKGSAAAMGATRLYMLCEASLELCGDRCDS